MYSEGKIRNARDIGDEFWDSLTVINRTAFRKTNGDDKLIETPLSGRIATLCNGFIGQYETDYNISSHIEVNPDDEDEAALVIRTTWDEHTDDSFDAYIPKIISYKDGKMVTSEIRLAGRQEITMYLNHLEAIVNLIRTTEYEGKKIFVSDINLTQSSTKIS